MAVSTAELVEALHRISRQLRHNSMQFLAPLGLTPAQDRTLRVITRAGVDGIRMGELAARLSVVPRSATGLVDGLEEAGLVRREPDPDSRRSVLVRLTDRGLQVQDDMAAARLTAGEDLLGPLRDADRRRLLDLLNQIVADERRPRC